MDTEHIERAYANYVYNPWRFACVHDCKSFEISVCLNRRKKGKGRVQLSPTADMEMTIENLLGLIYIQNYVIIGLFIISILLKRKRNG